jgi:hypothetical protein
VQPLVAKLKAFAATVRQRLDDQRRSLEALLGKVKAAKAKLLAATSSGGK